MGVLLYEALTGVLPFNASSYERLLVKILETRPVPPSKFQARLSPGLEAVILRALSPTPDGRPQSARAMLDELAAVQKDIALEPAMEVDRPDDSTQGHAR